ncbi:MAG: Hsp20/alpha crystallin family protein [Patescibacteria group bacterium]|jgi:HSP20 family protein
MKKKNKKEEEIVIQEIDDQGELEEMDELEEDGQLSVDVYQDASSIYIKSTIAGVEPEDIDISFDNDMITIRGKRKQDRTIRAEDYFYQECYWGGFSRSIILPVDVQEDKIKATIRNGILTIELPKAKKRDINISVQDDN